MAKLAYVIDGATIIDRLAMLYTNDRSLSIEWYNMMNEFLRCF